MLLNLARRAQRETQSQNICLAGGVALNVVSMGDLERSGLFTNVWVQPAAGDAGGALGAALWVSYNRLGVERIIRETDSMEGSFLGPEPGQIGASINDVLVAENLTGVHYSEEKLAERVGQLLADGMVVGVSRGRMEWGPRALGARSILADPRQPDTQRRLNLKTKFRESFRPFAPMVLAEDAANYFDGVPHAFGSPYMLKTYPVRHDIRSTSTYRDGEFNFDRINEVRSSIPAVTHLDYSARVQTIDCDRNPFIHMVISEFKKKTNCAVIVNTSFNVRGEPIVASAADSLTCFLLTDIDALVLGDMIIEKSAQTRPLPSAEEIEQALLKYELD